MDETKGMEMQGLTSRQLRRERRIEVQARKLDLSVPEHQVRVEVAAIALGEAKNAARILTEKPLPYPGGMAPALKLSQAYVYVKRAKLDALKKATASKPEILANMKLGIDAAMKAAVKGGKAQDILAVLDYEALLFGMPNKTTAARTVHLPDGKPDAPRTGGLTDAELEAIARLGLNDDPK